ncbi:hypothetical protein JA1_004583 [Spathaspora sp. JA1]|nr:hypothetical protein JA1_004583 [Spathaspora sp. JA1]
MPTNHSNSSPPMPSSTTLHKHNGPQNSTNVASSPDDAVLATPQLKKKRGRPPKPDSLTNRITTTLNIDVHTSPLTSSPNAESNSNSIVKQGAPDFFTPLMRVSPSARSSTRRKRKNSTSSSLAGSPALAKKSKSVGDIGHTLITPSSSVLASTTQSSPPFPAINSKVMENISMITQNGGVAYYTTPPSSSINSDFPSYLTSSGTQLGGSVIYSAPGAAEEDDKLRNSSSISSSSSITSSQSKQPVASASNLLPAVTLTGQASKNVTPKQLSKEEKSTESSNFSLKLKIDDSGKAVLSNDFFASLESSGHNRKEKEEIRKPQPVEETVIPPTKLVRSNSVIGFETAYQPNLEEHTIQQQQEAPSTAIPAALPLRRHNSDLTGISVSTILQTQTLSSISENSIIPQTPKDSYFSSSNLGTGLTPIFNLTPQFNSLMYSMMNINSPKRNVGAGASGVNLITPDFFTSQQQEQRSQLHGLEEEARLQTSTITMNELMGPGDIKENVATDTLTSGSSVQASEWSSSEDSGDARLALKKIMHVKRR